MIIGLGARQKGSQAELPDENTTDHTHTDPDTSYSERSINTIEDLVTFVRAMDQDEGIRIVGEVEGYKGGGFIFVAKSGDKYCLNICDRIYDPSRKAYQVGGNDSWYYFDNFEDAWTKLKTLLHNPLEAYAY